MYDDNGAMIELFIYLAAFIVTGLIAIIGYAATAGRRQSGADVLRDKWREAADALGLTFREAGPGGIHPGTLRGDINGMPVVVDAADVKRKRVTRIRAPFHAPLPLDFTLEASDRGSRSPIKTGDTRFDQAFHVQGDDANAILAMLTPEVRLALCELDAFRPSPAIDTIALTVTPEAVTFCKLGVLSPQTGLTECVEMTAALSKLVEVGVGGR